ncbi:hypothetical protein AJ79_01285 [Helicocarpus griseus UAMH5409]|uniref:Uncharacterized protein n=1 Tax=Helicocarpus griseus UAMH5409 TaxID=1447875 RepID=A0A2B7Y956_9EURO|nr:hypothetical protein AJ79_01285 [Helicocarpus griseus UAMH5409]
MRFESFTILAAALTTAFALPGERHRIQMINNAKEASKNLNVFFSDDVVKIGTVSVEDIRDKLFEACHTKGQCDTSDSFEFTSQIHASGRSSGATTIKVKVNPDGAYPTWIRNGLVEAIYAAAKQVVKCKDVTTTPTCPNAWVYCPERKFTTKQCEVPKYWGVNYQHPDEKNAAPPHISVDFDVEVDHGGFCEDLMDSAAAVAGKYR